MAPSTLDSSTSMVPVARALESNCGPMDPSTLGSGPKAKPVALGGSSLLTATATRATGSQTRPTEKEPTCMQMERDMRDSG